MKLIAMLNNDNSDFNFYKNGLYMIFKSCARTSEYRFNLIKLESKTRLY